MRDMVKLPVDSEEMISATRKAAVCRLPIGGFPVPKKMPHLCVCVFFFNIPKDVAGLDKSFLR